MKRRVFTFLLVVCCFALLAGGVRAVVGSERLLQRAVRLKITQKEETTEGSYLWGHWWTPNNEMLEFHIEQGRKPAAFSLLRHNLHTGLVTTIPLRLGEGFMRRYSNPALSPDGKWLMWHNEDAQDTVHVWNMATGQRLSWPTGGDDYRHFTNYWLADSRHWLEYVTMPFSVTLHDTANPKKNIRMTMPPLQKGQHSFIYMNGVLTNAGRMLTSHYEFDPDTWGQSGLTLQEFALQPEQGKVVRLKIYRDILPKGLKYINHVCSPTGDRILWTTEGFRETPIQLRPQRVMPKSAQRKQTWVGLWTSRLDGSDWREIGHIIVPLADNGDDAEKGDTDNLIEEAGWLPDGKTAWFKYKDAYYSATVN